MYVEIFYNIKSCINFYNVEKNVCRNHLEVLKKDEIENLPSVVTAIV